MLHPQQTLRCGHQLLDLSEPQVMGILNITPDSFFDGGKYQSVQAAVDRAGRMLEEGAAILDVGGMSSRPGAEIIEPEEELERVLPVLDGLHAAFPQAPLSIDTIRAEVARQAVRAGACMINDISAGRYDPGLFAAVAELNVPYILMHMQGEPKTMQRGPAYKDVVLEVLDFFLENVAKLRALGVVDILLDPGFGFGKTVAHNYRLLQELRTFQMLDCPILAGLSRKSMICRVLEVAPAQALNGTTALHMVALQQGARLLRVHDVREARQVIRLWTELEKAKGN
jgi:dihydropteroate synthase